MRVARKIQDAAPFLNNTGQGGRNVLTLTSSTPPSQLGQRKKRLKKSARFTIAGARLLRQFHEKPAPIPGALQRARVFPPPREVRRRLARLSFELTEILVEHDSNVALT